MKTSMLSGLARFYARRALRDAADARHSQPAEADLAASALRADDAAFSAERAADAHRWSDLVDRTRDARLYSRQAHQLSLGRSRATGGAGAPSGTRAPLPAWSVGRHG